MAEGRRFGAYEALLELAAGGMGTVFVARKVGPAGFERLAVIKRVHTHLLRDREFHDMLRDEAKIASLIVHPNVVGVEDVIDAGGELLLAQPYVESVSFSELLQAAREAGERLPPAVVVRVLSDVLAGLHAAHEARDLRGEPLRVVHRDVSPHNVLTGTDGRSRLIDFGIAKAERRVTQTRSGVMKGKLAYMPPEALRSAPLDRRADVFAAGVMLHEALTGCRLFSGEDDADVLLAVMVQEIEPPSAVDPSLPAALDAPVLRALERRPEDRTPTAADLQEAIERAVAPASPREVQSLVERLCGEKLRAQRASLRAALDRSAAPAPASPDDPTGSDSPSAGRSTSVTAVPGGPPGHGSADGHRRSGLPRGAVLAVLALLVGVGAAIVFSENSTDPEAGGPATPASAAIAPPAQPAATSTPGTATLGTAPLTTAPLAPDPSTPPETLTAEPAAAAPAALAPGAPSSAKRTARPPELHRNPYHDSP